CSQAFTIKSRSFFAERSMTLTPKRESAMSEASVHPIVGGPPLPTVLLLELPLVDVEKCVEKVGGRDRSKRGAQQSIQRAPPLRALRLRGVTLFALLAC